MRVWPAIFALLPTGLVVGAEIDDYMALAVGSFDSAEQAESDDRYERAVWHIAEIWIGDDPSQRWLYAENRLAGSGEPYRQRIVRIGAEDDGTLTARSYRFAGASAYTGAWQNPARFDELERSLLMAAEGCDVTLVKTGHRRFEGTTRGVDCRTSYKDATYVVSRSTLTEDVLVNWDRGFRADGTRAWGPAAGGYVFARKRTGDGCVKPVRLLVFGTVNDRAKFGTYARALAESGLYRRHGGYYEALTPPLAVLEGEPPPGRGAIIARFPCRAAAENFWNSPAYREIVPLRDGVAEFEVLLLPAVPIPSYAH